ncbi:hypothetical protein HOE425_331739 [Hoeflea sp. EC-HK425]|nr:hypothetical protein HOE425_331739 [Hoeflea sp. EC-HK425]
MSDALLCRHSIEPALNGKFIRHSSEPTDSYDARIEKGTLNSTGEPAAHATGSRCLAMILRAALPSVAVSGLASAVVSAVVSAAWRGIGLPCRRTFRA